RCPQGKNSSATLCWWALRTVRPTARATVDGVCQLLNEPALDQIVALAFGCCRVILATARRTRAIVIKMDRAFADDFGDGLADHDGRAFIEANAKNLRIAAHEARHI